METFILRPFPSFDKRLPGRTIGRMATKGTTPEPAFVDNYLPALLGQASHLIQSEFHRVVKAKGLSVAEWRVLATLASGQPMTTGKLAEVSLTKGPTATRMLDRMQARGQVERLAHDADRRVTMVRITAEGRRKVSRLMALAQEHEQRVLEPLGAQRAEELKATLRRIVELHQPGENVAA